MDTVYIETSIVSHATAKPSCNLGDDLHAEFERAKAAGHPVADIRQRSIRRTGSGKLGEPVVEDLSSSPTK